MAKKQSVAEYEETLGDGVTLGEGEDLEESCVVDLGSVEDTGFTPVPKGMYDCVVESIEYKISQRSGNPMWAWVFEVEDGEFAGRKFFYHTVFKGAGLPMTKRTLSRLAPELLNGAQDFKKLADEGFLVGTRVRVRVDIQKYENEKRNNVKDVYAAADASEAFA